MPSPFEMQLVDLLSQYEALKAAARHEDASDVISNTLGAQLTTRCIAAIERAAGRESVYFEQIQKIPAILGNPIPYLAAFFGVVSSLLEDIRGGYLRSFAELIHGEVFSDFLEMADHLLVAGYKDAAAVLAGSTLEAHLKQLCKKAGIATEANGKSKKADTINSELKAAKVYTLIDQKAVTGWLGTRNSAAHGDYGDYDKTQVKLLIDSVRNFISRVPA